MFVCLFVYVCLTSKQQLRSYEDRAIAYNLIPHAAGDRDQNRDPCGVVFPLHQGGSYLYHKIVIFFIFLLSLNIWFISNKDFIQTVL